VTVTWRQELAVRYRQTADQWSIFSVKGLPAAFRRLTRAARMNVAVLVSDHSHA
jgi:hypothetical protein